MLHDDSFEEIPEYREVDDSESDDEQLAPKKQRGKEKEWALDRVLPSTKEALKAVKDEESWSIQRNHDTEQGVKVFYRCNKAKKRSAIQCPSGLYLLYHADSDKVSLFRTTEEHDHSDDASRGLDPEVKVVVMQLLNDGINKPKKILSALRDRKMKEPPLKALNNFLYTFRKEKYGPPTISLAELEEWCKENSTPNLDNPDDPFVVSYSIDIGPGGKSTFRFFAATPRLLRFAAKTEYIQADATYKLIWQGYPVFVFGTSDQDRKFFPVGVGVCTGEAADDFQFQFTAQNPDQTYRMKIRNQSKAHTTIYCASQYKCFSNVTPVNLNHPSSPNFPNCFPYASTKLLRHSHFNDRGSKSILLIDPSSITSIARPCVSACGHKNIRSNRCILLIFSNFTVSSSSTVRSKYCRKAGSISKYRS